MSFLHHSNAHWLSPGARASVPATEWGWSVHPSSHQHRGKHVAIACLRQTVKLVLNATKQRSAVWTAVVSFSQSHLVFV